MKRCATGSIANIAAMSAAQYQGWFYPFIYKLLQNDRQTLDLLANDPFPNAPPKYIRAQLYRYHFTNFGERGWWKRELLGYYMPPARLQDSETDCRIDAGANGRHGPSSVYVRPTPPRRSVGEGRMLQPGGDSRSFSAR